MELPVQWPAWEELQGKSGRVGGGVLRNPEGTGTPQEDESQLTWAQGDSQRLEHQPKSIHRLDLAPSPGTYVAEVLGLHAGPTKDEQRLSLTPPCLILFL